MAAVPGERAVGINDFSQFDPQRINRTTFESRRSGLGLKNVTLVNADYEDALEALHGTIGERKVGVYFVDGPHDYRSQLMCLLLAKPYLSEHAVIVVDDCNYEHVRQANSDFLRTNPEFRLFFEAYTPAHPNNMTDSQLECARRGWWNGVNVIVRDPEGLLEPICPDTPRGRDLFLATHEVQSHRGAYGVMHALRLADSLMRGRVIKAVRSAFGFARSIRRNRYQLSRDASVPVDCNALRLPQQFLRNVKEGWCKLRMVAIRLPLVVLWLPPGSIQFH